MKMQLPQKDDRDHTAGEEVLLGLAERCEREAGGQLLDDAIWTAVLGLPSHTEGEPFKAGNPPRRTRLSIPAYTTSLDAAVTLVPEKWSWRADKNCSARVSNFNERYSSKAKTTALALCAASLRARAAIVKARRRA